MYYGLYTCTVCVNVEYHGAVPVKVYWDLKCTIVGSAEGKAVLTWGRCMDHEMDRLSRAFTRLTKSVQSKFGKLTWWDQLRYKVHGKLTMNLRHTTMQCARNCFLDNVLQIHFDNGMIFQSLGIVKVLARDFKVTVSTQQSSMCDMARDVKGLSDMAALDGNKQHALFESRDMSVLCLYHWMCGLPVSVAADGADGLEHGKTKERKQSDEYPDNPCNHYLHHTYWMSEDYEHKLPDDTHDLYERFRSKQLRLMIELDFGKLQSKPKNAEKYKQRSMFPRRFCVCACVFDCTCYSQCVCVECGYVWMFYS